MINAISVAISNALFNEFGYENHMEEIKQDLEEPCFLISCIGATSQRYPGNRYLRKNQYVITYFPKSEHDANAECNETAERMNRCLEVIQTGEGFVRGSNMEYKTVDKILHFHVNYDCFVYRQETSVTMGSMNSEINAKGW